MNSGWRRLLTPILFHSSKRSIARTTNNLIYKHVNITSSLIISQQNYLYNSIRFKSKKHSKIDSDDEKEDFNDDSSLSRDSKVMKFNTTSMRADIILKSALGVARNKIEQIFYESKIRINGRKIMKKSVSVRLGDEVDIIKTVSPHNPEHLYVSRVEILSVTPSEDNIVVTARRFRTLLIENYEIDPYKSSVPESEN